MPSLKKRTNTLCVVSFLIILLGIGLYCIFKPPTPPEHVQTLPESQIRTSIDNLIPPRNPSLSDDNIELIDT